MLTFKLEKRQPYTKGNMATTAEMGDEVSSVGPTGVDPLVRSRVSGRETRCGNPSEL